MRIGIIGAGHAGVASAFEVAKLGAEVTLFSEEKHLPYFRPRVTSVAFSGLSENGIFMHPAGWYSDNGIDIILGTRVVRIDITDLILSTDSGQTYKFDRVIFATGAKPIIPPFANVAIEHGKASTLWTLDDAVGLKNRLFPMKKITIIGGGVIGIEAALRARDVGLEVDIIEAAPRLMIRNLSVRASETLARILKDKGIRLFTNTSVEKLKDCLAGIEVYTDTEVVYSDFVVLSIGGAPDLGVDGLQIFDLKEGIPVNSSMRTSCRSIFAAGDVALVGDVRSPCSALKAAGQGRIAGINAAATDSFVSYELNKIAIEMKFKDFELHSIGCIAEDGCNREDVLEVNNHSYRAVIKRGGYICGIQMVGSGKDFTFYKKQLV